MGAKPGLRHGVNGNESGSVGSSVRVLVALLVGGMNVSHRGTAVWPFVPVQLLQPGEQPWENQRQGWLPTVGGRSV